MLIRLFTITLVLLTISACSQSDKEAPITGINDGEINRNVNGYSESTGYSYADPDIDSSNLEDINPGTAGELSAVVGDRIFFTFNSAEINPISAKTLQRQAMWLKQYENIRVTIEGHCDERGTREYNLALGERRANSVKKFLVKQGVSPNRIDTISYGKEHPEYLGSNEASWSKNRRSVTVVN